MNGQVVTQEHVVSSKTASPKESPKIPKVSLHKLGQYFESNDSNSMLPIIYQNKKVTAILDGWDGVSIIT